MGKIFNMGKNLQERDQNDTVQFLRNIALNGLFGSRDPEKCHHPIVPIMPFMRLGNKKYYLRQCRDCGKIFEIFKK